MAGSWRPGTLRSTGWQRPPRTTRHGHLHRRRPVRHGDAFGAGLEAGVGGHARGGRAPVVDPSGQSRQPCRRDPVEPLRRGCASFRARAHHGRTGGGGAVGHAAAGARPQPLSGPRLDRSDGAVRKPGGTSPDRPRARGRGDLRQRGRRPRDDPDRPGGIRGSGLSRARRLARVRQALGPRVLSGNPGTGPVQAPGARNLSGGDAGGTARGAGGRPGGDGTVRLVRGIPAPHAGAGRGAGIPRRLARGRCRAPRRAAPAPRVRLGPTTPTNGPRNGDRGDVAGVRALCIQGRRPDDRMRCRGPRGHRRGRCTAHRRRALVRGCAEGGGR